MINMIITLKKIIKFNLVESAWIFLFFYEILYNSYILAESVQMLGQTVQPVWPNIFGGIVRHSIQSNECLTIRLLWIISEKT